MEAEGNVPEEDGGAEQRNTSPPATRTVIKHGLNA
jgi:hypothetical protein